MVCDPDGGWKRAVARALGNDPDGTMLLVLDRFAAPRVGSASGEAGGLIAPNEATEWLRFLTLECPECGGEVSWPE